jgi:ABC-type glycerol-3-phosphate transport system substrate-binding protein
MSLGDTSEFGGRSEDDGLTRRVFLLGVGGAALLAACGGSEEVGGGGEVPGAPPQTVFHEPATKLSGDLRILMWSHFVPRHDRWFDGFARDWGKRVGVNVTVDHINVTEIPARISAEVAARRGHDLSQFIATLAQFEPSVLDLNDVVQEAEKRHGKMLDICRRSSFNPTTEKFFAYGPAWAPDPGDYRRSLWQKVGMPDGPSTWQQLLEGGREIKRTEKIPVGIGMSQEIDSNMAAWALIWSFGGKLQDAGERVVLNSPEVVDAVAFMARLYKEAMTPEVFAWNPASNNQGLIAGKLSYILNSISAWRTAQVQSPKIADDVYFRRALRGPKDALAGQHVMYNWIVPKHAKNPAAAKEFLLHYTANLENATYQSELYDFPAFSSLVPKLDGWLKSDPFRAKPKDKLAVLDYGEAVKWTANIGHPGPTNTAIGEVLATFVLPNMMAKAARGDLSPKEAVAQADRQCQRIFAKWRGRGLIGGGTA